MKNVKQFTFGAILVVTMLFTNDVNAKRNNGNYIGTDGCLHVWTSYTLFGIEWSYSEEVFCNGDGMPFDTELP